MVAVTIAGDRAVNVGLCSALRAFELGGIFIATRDLGLYGLIRYNGTHVTQWDSNLRRKDHQIFAPNALNTAPRGRLSLSVFNNV
jgi:hypothetical protein